MRAWILLGALALPGCGTLHNTVSDGADERLILRGNDAVAYFTEGRPVSGLPGIKSSYAGDTYRFASEANKRRFDADPARYAPAYTGFCSSGAPYALKSKIGPEIFVIHKGRLHLFGDERAKLNWMIDADENVRLGDEYWEKETKDVPHRLQNFKRLVFKVPHYQTDAELDAERARRGGK